MESYDEITMKKAVDELKQGINPLELKTYDYVLDGVETRKSRPVFLCPVVNLVVNFFGNILKS